jgi:hypothetical protein
MSEWQPIETAPHGVDVLLFTPAIPGTISRDQPVYEVRPHSFGRPGSRSCHAFATHWMPLPESPK